MLQFSNAVLSTEGDNVIFWSRCIATGKSMVIGGVLCFRLDKRLFLDYKKLLKNPPDDLQASEGVLASLTASLTLAIFMKSLRAVLN